MKDVAYYSSTPGSQGENHSEGAEGYPGELFRTGEFRIAVCQDGLQCLLQRRRPAVSPGEPAWETLGSTPAGTA